MININNLHKSFDNKIVLNGLNLDIEKGSSSVIIGGPGTGTYLRDDAGFGLIADLWAGRAFITHDDGGVLLCHP